MLPRVLGELFRGLTRIPLSPVCHCFYPFRRRVALLHDVAQVTGISALQRVR